MKLTTAISLATGVAFALVGHSPGPAHAATAIDYSAKKDSYGWCAGYGAAKAKRCAEQNCDGADCQLVLECKGGFGAIALPADPAYGIGASCDFPDGGRARVAAIANCMVVTRALCWTDSAFNARGDEFSDRQDQEFDRAWFAQVLLQLLHYDTGDLSGALTKEVKAALKDFQKKIGRPQTGNLDDEIIDRMVDAVGGAQRLAKIVKRDVVDKHSDEMEKRVFFDASVAVPETTFSQELNNGPRDHRLLALATILAVEGNECSLPARAATLSAEENGRWEIECAEANYTLLLSDDWSMTVTQRH